MDKKTIWNKYNTGLNENVISFAVGAPSEYAYRLIYPLVKKATKDIFSHYDNKIFNYSLTQGLLELRKLIALKMNQEGVDKMSENEVLITSGGQQAIKLIIDCLITEDDVVMLENVSYVGLDQMLLDSNANVVSLDKEINKFSPIEFEKVIKFNRPKLLFLIPDFANPTGGCISIEKRKFIGKLSLKYKFWVIDDQTYRNLYYDSENLLPAMKNYGEKVITIGSFSKDIAPGFRLGWLAIKDNKLLEQIKIKKESYDISTSSVDQEIVLRILLSKQADNVMGQLRQYYARKMNRLRLCLKNNLPKQFKWNNPKGGYYLWVEGPDGFDAEKILETAKSKGIVFIPGEIFYYSKSFKNTFRLSVGNLPEDEIEDGVNRLAEVLVGKKTAKEKTERSILSWHHHLQQWFGR